LEITSIVLTPAAPVAAAPFTAKVTFKNSGPVTATRFYLDVWSHQATAQLCGAAGTKWVSIPTLAAGATTSVTITGLTAGATGSRTARAYVDSWCEVLETTETTSNQSANQMTKTY